MQELVALSSLPWLRAGPQVRPPDSPLQGFAEEFGLSDRPASVYLIFFLNVIFCERRNLSSLRRDVSEKDFELSKDLCLLPRTQERVLLGYLICAGSSKGDLSKGCFRRPKPSLCLCLARVFSVPSRLFSSFWLLFGFFCSRGNHG